MNKCVVKKFIFDCLYNFKLKILYLKLVNLIMDKAAEVLFLPFILKVIGDKYQNNTLTIFWIIFLVFLYTIVFSMKVFVSACFWKQLFYKISTKFDNNVRQKIFDFVINHSISFFNDRQAGVLTSKIDNVVSSFGVSIDLSFTLLSTIIVTFVSFFIYLKIDYRLFIFLLIWTVLFLIYNYFSSKIIAKCKKEYIVEENKISGLMTDDFTNILNIKSSSKQFIEKRNVKKQGIYILRAINKLLNYNIIFGIIIFIFMSVLTCFILMYAVRLFFMSKITIGTMIFIGQNVIFLSFNLKRAYKETSSLINECSRLFNGFDDIMEEHNIVDKKDSKELNIINGKIVFKNVQFKY